MHSVPLVVRVGTPAHRRTLPGAPRGRRLERLLQAALLVIGALALGVLSGSGLAHAEAGLGPDGTAAGGAPGVQLPPAIAELLESTSDSTRKTVFIVSYVLCLMVCMPGSSGFDYTAGYAYGFCTGVALIALAKGIAAMLTFLLVQALQDSRALQLFQGTSRGRRDAAARWATRIRQGVRNDCFRFCLLARLAPLQASFVNYLLSVAGVPFATYLAASVLGMLPPICNNVYAGVAAASVRAAVSSGGKGGSLSSVIGVLLVVLSMFSSAALLKQLAGSRLGSDEDPESNGLGEDNAAIGVTAEPTNAA